MPHKVLEMIGIAPCVDAEWRGRLGAAYCALSRFLVVLPDTPLSETYYCSHCGGKLKVQPAPDSTFVALAESEDATCPVVEKLVTKDLALKKLNISAFYRSCLGGLGMNIRVQSLPGLASTWRLGSLCVAGKRYAVFASLLSDISESLSVIRAIPEDKPFVFIGGSYHHECEEFLNGRNSGYLCLEDDFELIVDTGVHPKDSASEKMKVFKTQLTKTIDPPDPVEGVSYLFRLDGDKWKVIFSGNKPFYLDDLMGARYMDYLLHHPNNPLSAQELECAIRAERENARTDEAIHAVHDQKALQQYAKRLRALRAEQDSLEAEGNTMAAGELSSEIQALEKTLDNENRRVFGDAGERARNNVRKAISAVQSRLEKMPDRGARDFVQHISNFLRKGYTLIYNKPESITWS